VHKPGYQQFRITTNNLLIKLMHNIKSNFDKVFHTIKSLNLLDFGDRGIIMRPLTSPLFTDIVVISYALTAEYMSLDSENCLFKKIQIDDN
jgi:hypothetical protein